MIWGCPHFKKPPYHGISSQIRSWLRAEYESRRSLKGWRFWFPFRLAMASIDHQRQCFWGPMKPPSSFTQKRFLSKGNYMKLPISYSQYCKGGIPKLFTGFLIFCPCCWGCWSGISRTWSCTVLVIIKDWVAMRNLLTSDCFKFWCLWWLTLKDFFPDHQLSMSSWWFLSPSCQ